MDTLTAHVCALPPGRLCEGPIWDPRTQHLLWVDIRAGHIHRATLTDATPGPMDRAAHPDLVLRDTISLEPPLSAVLPCASGGLLVAVGDAIFRIDDAPRHSGVPLAGIHPVAMDPGQKHAGMTKGSDAGMAGADRSGVAELFARVPLAGDGVGSRLNDAKVDPRGRLLAGTMAEEGGVGGSALYRVDPDGTLSMLRTGVTISNGLGWSPDGRTLYYADSPTRRVDAFDYDLDSGTIGAGRPFAYFADGDPDGLTVDAEGNVWVAVWGAGQVRAFDPDGTLRTTVEVGPSQVSSCTFAGPDLDVLVITTAAEREAAREPHAGSLFTCVPGVIGRPATPFADEKLVLADE
ncbi:SMP-30/gluconolactonase/LRE family protein [Nocardia sp. NPDC059240]|uniref:SMP-30/gluconolactonase/LRE family protein n=1 Tax=Nocardia sp. NPDC059240 TaxID=3346786 RepID=UPI0036BD3CDF